jgi:uncharacterized membrane protein YeaQ/YmgE (transglycosylase-associated protein family)
MHFHWVWLLLVGLIAGWLAGLIMRGRGFGLGVDIVLGIVGAWIGGNVLGWLGIHAYGLLGSLATAVIGAVILLLLIRLVKTA